MLVVVFPLGSQLSSRFCVGLSSSHTTWGQTHVFLHVTFYLRIGVETSPALESIVIVAISTLYVHHLEFSRIWPNIVAVAGLTEKKKRMLLYRLFVALFLAIGWGILSAGLSPSVGLEYLGRRVGRGLGASEAPSANEARLLLVGSLPLPDPASTSFLVFSSEKLGLLAGCFDEVDAAAGWVTVSRRQL